MAEFEIKTKSLGLHQDEAKELRVPSKVIRWENEGVAWQADHRHPELITSQLCLRVAKSVVTPGVKSEDKPKTKDRKEEDHEVIDKFQELLCKKDRDHSINDGDIDHVSDEVIKSGRHLKDYGSRMR